MALIKEPYGLVYNTDGSLYVTYRDDDIPFQGVRSFAVETSTTNLIQNPQFATGDFSNWVVIGSANFELDEGHKAKYSVKSLPNYDGRYKSVQQTVSTVVGQTYTLSFWIKHSTEVTSPYRFYIFLKRVDQSNVDLRTSSYFDGQWHKKTYTFTAEESSYIISVETAPNQTNGLSWISDIQLERKSYPTSFVDGSRIDGTVNCSGFNENSWVVNFWYKNTYPGNLGVEGFGMRFVQDTGYLHFRNGIDNTHFFLSQDSVSNQFTIFLENLTDGQWRNFVVIYDPNELKFYVNGVYRATVTSIDFTRKLIGVQLWGRTNSLFSNIFIGKYRRDDDSVIWTDDYIREVYEAKIPFPVSNKLSIY